MTFEIEQTSSVKLTHLNVRTEKHGDDDVPAMDLEFEWTTSNRALALFNAKLVDRLYLEGETRSKPVEGVETVRTALAFPEITSVPWKQEDTGMMLIIEHGLGGKSDLVLRDCTVDKFKIRPLEGGTVEIKFKARTSSQDDVLDRLKKMLEHEVPMRLVREHPVDASAPAGKGRRTPKQATLMQ